MKNDCITDRDEFILKIDKDGNKITTRDLQLAVLPIMDEIDRICRKHKIPYALHAGSALGAWNYKGFIPWDDDIDVAINRKDWVRFVEAMQKDLKDDFEFECYHTNKKFPVLTCSMKVRKKGTYLKETNTLLESRVLKTNGIFVDIIIYGNASESKFEDSLYRTYIKILTPFIIFFEAIRINPRPLKALVMKIAEHYDLKNENSKYTTQTIAFPWYKFKFLREDVYPLKEYEFEGRKYYSYNKLDKLLKEWYHPNCLRKWDGKKWVETLPIEKRHPKHIRDVNLNGDYPTEKVKNNNYIWGFLISIALFITALILFNEKSLFVFGVGIMILFITILMILTHKK